MKPLSANTVLDHYFLDARARLLDVAATLDRLSRGADAAATQADPRVAKLAKALEVLSSDGSNKAEQIQQIFSLEYDPGWNRPQPRF